VGQTLLVGGAGATLPIAPLFGMPNGGAPNSVPGNAKGTTSALNGLVQELTNLLGYGVTGVERNNRIPGRLACNLAELGGRTNGIRTRRIVLLSQAVNTVRELQKEYQEDEVKSGVGGNYSVTHNLNLLLMEIATTPRAMHQKRDLAKALIRTVIYATHGVHFEETREAQAMLRSAIRESKARTSILTVDKQQYRANYRYQVEVACRTVLAGWSFPQEPANGITSVWIMRRTRNKMG